MNKTDIEWCDFTWNPVTGCKRGCSYCYAKRIHDRFNKTPFSDIVFHPERLNDKMPKEPSKIFVGSMSDCQYWKMEWWFKILDVCSANPQHTFMFLSKSLHSFLNIRNFPDNCMQGLTLTLERFENVSYTISSLASLPRPFLSIEPILGSVPVIMPDNINPVIVGAMTGPKAVVPHKCWIEMIKMSVAPENIFWKSNIKEYL